MLEAKAQHAAGLRAAPLRVADRAAHGATGHGEPTEGREGGEAAERATGAAIGAQGSLFAESR
jgi:hypothetical protein